MTNLTVLSLSDTFFTLFVYEFIAVVIPIMEENTTPNMNVETAMRSKVLSSSSVIALPATTSSRCFAFRLNIQRSEPRQVTKQDKASMYEISDSTDFTPTVDIRV
ncbi:hypothetical protein D3C77_645420 [compost metagenome]